MSSPPQQARTIFEEQDLADHIAAKLRRLHLSKYVPHSNARQQARYLRQIAAKQLSGGYRNKQGTFVPYVQEV